MQRDSSRPRLRFFENAPGQQHIPEGDKYLYARETPRHRLAIIGTGTIGQEHMRVAQVLGRARVQGIFDPQPQSVAVALANFAALGGDAPVVYSSLEEACADSRVDAFMICTPNYTHLDVLKAVAGSGKPIFLEKPMATTLADAAATIDLARSYTAFIQIGLQYRYKAQYVEARQEVLARRTLGEVSIISMSEFRPPFLDKVGQWNKFNEFSGGTLVEKCCHYFDLMNLFADSRPTRVYASAAASGVFAALEVDGRRSDIDDSALVIVEYESGCRASFALNMNCPDFNEELSIVGSEGRLVAHERFDPHHAQRAHCSLELELGERGASRKIELGYASAIEGSGHHGATYYEHAAFLDRIEGKAAEAATPEQGLWSMLVASAAQESSRSGQAVDIGDYAASNDLTRLL